MKKIFIALALATASCQTPQVLQAPAPCAASSIDEKGYVIALQTFDTMLTAIDRLQLAGVIHGGSPQAIKIADAIHDAKLAFQAAGAAQKACNTTNYFTAIAQAHAAISKINVLIKG